LGVFFLSDQVESWAAHVMLRAVQVT